MNSKRVQSWNIQCSYRISIKILNFYLDSIFMGLYMFGKMYFTEHKLRAADKIRRDEHTFGAEHIKPKFNGTEVTKTF